MVWVVMKNFWVDKKLNFDKDQVWNGKVVATFCGLLTYINQACRLTLIISSLIEASSSYLHT